MLLLVTVAISIVAIFCGIAWMLLLAVKQDTDSAQRLTHLLATPLAEFGLCWDSAATDVDAIVERRRFHLDADFGAKAIAPFRGEWDGLSVAVFGYKQSPRQTSPYMMRATCVVSCEASFPTALLITGDQHLVMSRMRRTVRGLREGERSDVNGMPMFLQTLVESPHLIAALRVVTPDAFREADWVEFQDRTILLVGKSLRPDSYVGICADAQKLVKLLGI